MEWRESRPPLPSENTCVVTALLATLHVSLASKLADLSTPEAAMIHDPSTFDPVRLPGLCDGREKTLIEVFSYLLSKVSLTCTGALRILTKVTTDLSLDGCVEFVCVWTCDTRPLPDTLGSGETAFTKSAVTSLVKGRAEIGDQNDAEERLVIYVRESRMGYDSNIMHGMPYWC
jgi:hypothetical protein